MSASLSVVDLIHRFGGVVGGRCPGMSHRLVVGGLAGKF